MVKVVASLALVLAVAACGGDSDDSPVIGYEREAEGCSSADACLRAGIESQEVAGIQLIHKRTPGNPWVTVRVMMDTGRTDAKSAHAEAMVLQLIDWYGSAEFVTTWKSELASIGATVFARSGLDYATVSLVVPAANVGRGFQLLAAAVNHPPNERVTSEWFETFRAGYAARLDAATDEVGDAASSAAWSLFARGHPYLRERKAVSSVGLVDLTEAATALDNQSVTTVTVVGDVSLASALTRVGASFPRTGFSPGKTIAVAFTPDSNARVQFVARPDAPATHLHAYFQTPAPSEADYAPLELGLRVLSTRLFEELRTKRGLVYTVGVAAGNYRRNYGGATLSTTELPETMAAFREVLQQLVSDGIEDAELEGARAQYRTDFFQDSHSIGSLSWMLGDWQMTSGDWRLAAEWMQRIAQVDAVAARDAVERYVTDMRYGYAGPKKYTEEEIAGLPPLPPESCVVTPTMCGCPNAVGTVEVCNGKDDDCDGRVDERVGGPEACNGRDDDCDGVVDEKVLVAEFCNGGDDDCDGLIDEQLGTLEVCNGLDDDCDQHVDEGVTAACGLCLSEVTPEYCPGHTVFISSGVFAASFGSAAGADAQCQRLAANAGRSGTWRAMIGDAIGQFDKRIHITKPVYNTAGKLVALTPEELLGGSIRAEIVTDETGREQPRGLLAWVGAPGADCAGWTSTSASDLGAASHAHMGTDWAANRKDVPCDSIAVLFCINQGL